MAIMSERTWSRHSNPWSGWTRTASFPLLFVPPWTRRWWLAAPIAWWFWLNPRLFPPPKDDSAWMTRGVLGEREWTAEARRRDLPMLLAVASGGADLVALVFAYRRRFWPTAAFAAPGFLLKLWFIDRMVERYDAARTSSSTPEQPSAGATTGV
jgi:hypothetical protein